MGKTRISERVFDLVRLRAYPLSCRHPPMFGKILFKYSVIIQSLSLRQSTKEKGVCDTVSEGVSHRETTGDERMQIVRLERESRLELEGNSERAQD